jgi:hypothetical protein
MHIPTHIHPCIHPPTHIHPCIHPPTHPSTHARTRTHTPHPPTHTLHPPTHTPHPRTHPTHLPIFCRSSGHTRYPIRSRVSVRFAPAVDGPRRWPPPVLLPQIINHRPATTVDCVFIAAVCPAWATCSGAIVVGSCVARWPPVLTTLRDSIETPLTREGKERGDACVGGEGGCVCGRRAGE